MNSLPQITLLLFLFAMSYCNASESSDEPEDKGQISSLKNTKINVAIVGGGFAGLAAFQRLEPIGLEKLDLFEASDRLGGRVYPIALEDGYLQHGAEYIHSLANPVYDIAERLNLINTSYDFDSEELFDSVEFKTGKCELDEDLTEEFKKFGKKVEDNLYVLAKEENNWKKSVGEIYKEKLEEFIESEDRSTEEVNQIKALSEFYKNYYEADWSTSLDRLSLKNFDTWSPLTKNESTIELNKIGYKGILDELTKDLPRKSIHLSSKVTVIDYSGEKTKLKINDDKFYETQYDYVIVTVPLGYLKAHANEMFEPKLPQQKSDVIEALGFGALLKVFLVYDKPFWTEDMSDTSFVPLQVEGCSKKSKLSSAFISVDAVSWKPNVLLVWVNGEAQKSVDDLSDSDLSTQITEHFKATMTNVTVTAPQRIIRKSWLKDDNYLGSYSFITPEAAKFEDPFKLMAGPVYNKQRPRILFAGEATHSQIYQTTSGAYLSGEREANRLLKFAKKYQ